MVTSWLQHAKNPEPNGSRRCPLAAFAVLTFLMAAPALAAAQPSPSDNKPYDRELNRLAEILGSVHYLRELCGAQEGQTWRDQMVALLNVEGQSAARRVKLTRSFNRGYRGYRRTYRACNKSATLLISRFMNEGIELAERLAQSKQ